MKTLALLHASQFVTLAGPKRPRTVAELSELAIIKDGGMLIRDGALPIGEGRIGAVGRSSEIRHVIRAETSEADVSHRA